MKNLKRRGRGARKVLVAVALVISGMVSYSAVVAAISVAYHVSTGSAHFTVEGKERVERDGVSSHEVYTSAGVYANKDSWLRLKYDSADLQNNLKAGMSYTCATQGFRLPFLSLMENIISCNETRN